MIIRGSVVESGPALVSCRRSKNWWRVDAPATSDLLRRRESEKWCSERKWVHDVVVH
jgi:hypothetical protein